jgi:ABC-type phosphate transport system substrate-binding protein
MFGCDKKNAGEKKTIVVDGSDTMVNLSQAWAEAYTKKHPEVSEGLKCVRTFF